MRFTQRRTRLAWGIEATTCAFTCALHLSRAAWVWAGLDCALLLCLGAVIARSDAASQHQWWRSHFTVHGTLSPGSVRALGRRDVFVATMVRLAAHLVRPRINLAAIARQMLFVALSMLAIAGHWTGDRRALILAVGCAAARLWRTAVWVRHHCPGITPWEVYLASQCADAHRGGDPRHAATHLKDIAGVFGGRTQPRKVLAQELMCAIHGESSLDSMCCVTPHLNHA